MEETLDERLERLYGPQKQHHDQVLYKEYWEVYSPLEMEIYEFMKKHDRKPDGREMAEILLGHKLIPVGEPCSEWDVWVEGYQATGEHGYHEFVGTFSAASFEDACKIAALKLAEGDMKAFNRYYNEKQNTWWGCHFYDNEADAAKAFG